MTDGEWIIVLGERGSSIRCCTCCTSCPFSRPAAAALDALLCSAQAVAGFALDQRGDCDRHAAERDGARLTSSGPAHRVAPSTDSCGAKRRAPSMCNRECGAAARVDIRTNARRAPMPMPTRVQPRWRAGQRRAGTRIARRRAGTVFDGSLASTGYAGRMDSASAVARTRARQQRRRGAGRAPFESDLARLWSECRAAHWPPRGCSVGRGARTAVRAACGCARAALTHPPDEQRWARALDAAEASVLAARRGRVRVAEQAVTHALDAAGRGRGGRQHRGGAVGARRDLERRAAVNAAAFAAQAAGSGWGDCAMMGRRRAHAAQERPAARGGPCRTRANAPRQTRNAAGGQASLNQSESAC